MAHERLTAAMVIIAVALIAFSSGFVALSDGEDVSSTGPIKYNYDASDYTYSKVGLDKVAVTGYGGASKSSEIPSHVAINWDEGSFTNAGETYTVSETAEGYDLVRTVKANEVTKISEERTVTYAEGTYTIKDGDNVVNTIVEGTFTIEDADGATVATMDDGKSYTLTIGGKSYTITKNGGTYTITKVAEIYTVVEIAAKAFKGCEDIFFIKIPETVSTISDYAFLKSYINTVEFGNGSQLDKIGKQAFYLCANLIWVDIPEGTEEIGDYAFSQIGGYGYDSLNNFEDYEIDKDLIKLGITIPSSVTKIGFKAFQGSTTTVWFADNSSLYEVKSHAFNEGNGNLEVKNFTPTVPIEIGVGNYPDSSYKGKLFTNYSSTGVGIGETTYPYTTGTKSIGTGITISVYHVNYVYNSAPEGVETPEKVVTQVGENVELPSSLYGYTIEWVLTPSVDISEGAFAMPAENVTATGTWKPVENSVTFQYVSAPEGVTEPGPITGTYKQVIPLPDVSVEGYAIEWVLTPSVDISEGAFAMPAENVTATGTWKPVENSVTFRYVSAPEGVTEPGSIAGTYKQVISLPDVSVEGYTIEWVLTPSIEISEDGSFIMPAENVTATGTWEPIANPDPVIVPGTGTVDETVNSQEIFNTESIVPIETFSVQEEQIDQSGSVTPVTPVTPVPTEEDTPVTTTASTIGDFDAGGVSKVMVLLFLILGGLYIVKRELA